MRTYTFETDKTYTLKYGYNAICDIEEASGKPIQALFQNGEIGLNTVRLILWAGLRYKLQGMTKQQVGFILDDLVENGKFQEVASKAIELLAKSLGQGGEETEGEF